MKRKLGVLLAIPAAVAAVAIPTVADSADGSRPDRARSST